ncbi:MAG: class I SAM-dependent methyltransferase [Candidatus Omnitrophica bacterium]|nr:class I SAM-dependent methyltransferase [Candidatus Omnitrophota bacterium]
MTRLIYHPVAGVVFRNRYRMVLDLLERTQPIEQLLEAGCGAGLLLPSLAAFGAPLRAIDLHGYQDRIRAMLSALRIREVGLFRADIRKLPFPEQHFSHIVCVSVLEHLRGLEEVFRELRRTVRPEGWLIVGVPTKNWITRILFASVGYDDNVIHPSSHRDVLRAAEPCWQLQRLRVWPPGAPLDLSLYVAMQLKARADG